MKKEDLKVGQTVWVASRPPYRNVAYEITEEVIEKIGKKYFETDRSKYYIETGNILSNYSTDCTAYLDISEFNKKQERLLLHKKVAHLFTYQNELTLDQLRRIDAIISETES